MIKLMKIYLTVMVGIAVMFLVFAALAKGQEFNRDFIDGKKGYYSVKDGSRNESAEIARLKSIIADLKEKIKTLTPPVTPPVPKDPPKPIGDNPNTEEREATELEAKVFSIFKNNCAECHFLDLDVETPIRPKGKLSLIAKKDDVELLLDLNILQRLLVHQSVSFSKKQLEQLGRKPMPLNSDPLTEAEGEILLQWIRAKEDEMKSNDK